ncbi:active breakpoint cluster region-related protein, partial [Biomphalaria glabrata]
KNRSSGGAVPRQVEKLRKKINQLEAQLILACPKLPFKVSLEGGKTYTLLMTTDYEREEWKETLASLMTRTEQQVISLNSIFIQELINSVKETPQVNKIGNVLLQPDEDILTGTLNVTIHKLNGLTEDCDTYCCLEMDSFGHFFMKAKTHIRHATRDPAWNEDFELELEGSQTIRFLCFKKEEGDHGDKLLGRGALELSRHWLKSSFQEKTVVMNEISLVISVRHTAADKTMSRTPSRTSSAVFGVKISTCARREGKTVPSLVTACLQEVEKRGLDEVGIYRVSGVTSDLQRIKKLFDKNVRAGIAALEDADIHTVTGTLKLYLRELPEPLFTEANYQNFIDTLKLKDEEARGQCMLNLLHGLPDINYYTIVSLLEHLLKVARNVSSNKMSVHNLATVFGPTLLAPAVKQDTTDPMELMFKGAEEVMHQSSVINYLLGIAISGRSLRKSAQ